MVQEPLAKLTDVDEDGIVTEEDCDDEDAALGAFSEDGDCDGVLTAEDCDDEDAASTTIAMDSDCDTVLAADDCDDTDASIGTELSGSAQGCPWTDCAQILEDGFSTGDGLYWIDPQADGSAYEAYCLIDDTYDGGGWTLISVHSDENQHSWTWSNRHYFDTDTTTFGSLDVLHKDFKSRALHEVAVGDLLFLHQPSSIWVAYRVEPRSSFGAFIESYGEHVCYSGTDGFNMVAGTLTHTGNMCSTQLFINPADHDNDASDSPCYDGGDSTYGPAWSIRNNDGCYLDDPGTHSALGPASFPTTQNDEWSTLGIGFSWGVGGEHISTGEGTHYMQVFVRHNQATSGI